MKWRSMTSLHHCITAMAIWLWINTYTYHFYGDEHPFTSYFDVHQGDRVLTHPHLLFPSPLIQPRLDGYDLARFFSPADSFGSRTKKPGNAKSLINVFG